MNNSKLVGIIVILLMVFLFGSKGIIPLPIVNPAPIDKDGLYVMVVEDKAQRSTLPQDQIEALTTSLLQQWISDHGGQFRRFSPKPDFTAEEDFWVKAFSRPRQSTPWILISNKPNGGTEQPFPANTTELINLLEKYKGSK